MASESTFDIVSEFDRQELVNVVDQTRREVGTRYDLKDSKTTLDLGEDELVITSSSEMHLQNVREVLETKAVRRNLSLKIFSYGKVEEIGGMRVRQVASLQKGIDTDLARKLQKMIRDEFPKKVQARIQGDAVRVGSKSRDELQGVIQFLREQEQDFPIPLQFTNYR
jgi:hypothetical protein